MQDSAPSPPSPGVRQTNAPLDGDGALRCERLSRLSAPLTQSLSPATGRPKAGGCPPTAAAASAVEDYLQNSSLRPLPPQRGRLECDPLPPRRCPGEPAGRGGGGERRGRGRRFLGPPVLIARRSVRSSDRSRSSHCPDLSLGPGKGKGVRASRFVSSERPLPSAEASLFFLGPRVEAGTADERNGRKRASREEAARGSGRQGARRIGRRKRSDDTSAGSGDCPPMSDLLPGRSDKEMPMTQRPGLLTNLSRCGSNAGGVVRGIVAVGWPPEDRF